MPSTAALELLVSLKDNASSGLDAIGEKGGGMGDLVKGGAIAAGGSILALGGFLVEATKAASDEQVGMDRLGTTLTANIPGWKGNEDAVEGYVSKMENMAFADDDVRDSLNKLVPRTHDLTEAQKLQATAMDLARAKNIDLSTATDIVGKVYGGNVGILGRYGIAVDKGATSTEALAAIQKASAGQAQAYADSAAGGMERLQTAFGDALETVGHEILPSVTQALSGLANFISSPEFQQGFQAFADFIGTTLGQGAAMLQQAFTDLQPVLEGVFNFLIGTALPALISFGGFLRDNAVPILILVGSIILSQVVPAFIAWGTTMLTTTLPALFATASATLAAMAPFLLIGAVVAGLFIAFQTNFLGIGDMVRSVWGIVQPIMQPFIDAFKTFFDTLGKGASIGDAIGQLFGNLGAAIQEAGPKIGPALQQIGALLWQWVQAAVPQVLAALGGLFQAIVGWIGANGPGILQTLGQWALAFAGWVLTVALPALLQALGGLITAVWNWITTNGPGIAAQLLQWAQIFGNWVLTTALPWLLSQLGSLVGSLWNWIVANGPGIAQQLLTWAQAFGAWVLNTALPALLQGLGSLIGTLWNWIVDNAPGIYAKLQSWKDAFFDWIFKSVLPNLPIWLGNIASALWTWLSQTAKDLGSKLVNEWLPAFWNWITGPGGVLATIGAKLAQIAEGIWTWITQTASGAAQKVLAIGRAIVDGIREGIQNGWNSFVNWVTGLLGGLVDAVKKFFGISSPSKLMADEVGTPMATGIGQGFSDAWDAVQKGIIAKIAAGQKQAKETAGNPAYAPGEPAYRNPAYEPGNGNPAYNPGEPAYRNPAYDPQNPAYNPGEPAYRNPAYDPQNPAYLPGGGQTGGNPAYGPNQPLAGSGGQGARAFGVGFTPIGGNAITIATLNIYAYPGMDGSTFASSFIDQLEEELSASVRTRRGV
jgi:phage-related protein